MKKNFTKRFVGNIPDPEGCEVVSRSEDWILFVRLSGESGWTNFKMVATHPAESKANYWLAYNRKERRFAENTDFKKLQEFPERLEFAKSGIEAYCGVSRKC